MADPSLERLRTQLVTGAVRHRRRRTQRLGVAAAVAVAILGVGAFVAVQDDDGSDVVASRGTTSTSTPSTSEATTSTTTPTTSTSPPSTAEPGTARLSPAEEDEAVAIVTRFLDALERNDLAAAADLWSGYPTTLGEPEDRAGAAERDELVRLRDDGAWLFDDGRELFVGPAWSWGPSAPVVTVLVDGDGATPPRAAAFLLAPIGSDTPDGVMGSTAPIQRVPASGPTASAIPSRGTVSPGDRIVVDGLPVEGGVVASVNGVEVPVEVDEAAMSMAVVVPERAEGEIALTVSAATPELPTADAYAYTVRP